MDIDATISSRFPSKFSEKKIIAINNFITFRGIDATGGCFVDINQSINMNVCVCVFERCNLS